jgi:putative tryptophan/tyrosine transport system ATP-binding protein
MISLNNVHKTFNKGSVNEVYALKGLNLQVNQGDWITIIGTNGSGKSTLLNAISGSFLPDNGTISIDGIDVTYLMEYERAKYISRVFQNPFQGTSPGMTIAENLHLASLRGLKRFPKIGLQKTTIAEYQTAIMQLEMQLDSRLHNVIGSLSGGQRQAITLLMAVMQKPKVLLLDEHTAALDPKTAAQVLQLTERFIVNYGLTVIQVTHSMQQALELGNRTIMMHKGKIIDDIPLNEKKQLTVDDMLDKFADLRKNEQLTEKMLENLVNQYK